MFILTTSDVERDEAVECCKRFKLCPISHVISPAWDKTAFYDAFYKVLEKELQIFLSDFETRTSTRQIYAIKCKLNFLVEKLQSRNASIKSPLTKQCLEIIKSYVSCYFSEWFWIYLSFVFVIMLILFFNTDQGKMVLLDIGSLEMNCISMKTNTWEPKRRGDRKLKIVSKIILKEKSILDR